MAGESSSWLDSVLSLPEDIRSRLLASLQPGVTGNAGSTYLGLPADDNMPSIRNSPGWIDSLPRLLRAPLENVGLVATEEQKQRAELLSHFMYRESPEGKAAQAEQFLEKASGFGPGGIGVTRGVKGPGTKFTPKNWKAAARAKAMGKPIDVGEVVPALPAPPVETPALPAPELPAMTPAEEAAAAAVRARRPGQLQTRTGKNAGVDAVGMIDWKSMTPLERQAAALSDIHIKDLNGKLVGSPDLAPEQLGGARTTLYDFVRPLTERPWVTQYDPWYERQRQGVEEASGPDPVKQHTLAQGIGVYSPQSTPDTNFTAATNQATHYATTGDPMTKVRTKAQMRNFANQIIGAGEATQGKKTGPFSVSSDPTRFDANMATNDIWVGRLMGYDKNKGEFSRGFTPQEHGFVQGEFQRMVAVANKEQWGGRSNWTAEELQAIPWVELKAQSLMKKRGLSYEDAIRVAMGTALEALPRNTTHLNNEVVPGAATGHIPAMLTAPLDMKRAYTQAPGNLVDKNGRHVLWQSLPSSYERPALPYTATYKNSQGVEELGYGNAFRPLTNRLSQGGGEIAPDSLHALRLIQGLHGLFGAQEGSVFGQFFEKGAGMKVSDINAALLKAPEGRAPISHADLAHLKQSGAAVGLPDAVHYGGGDVMLTNYDGPVNLSPKQRKQIEAAVQPGTELALGRQQGEGVWLKKQWAKPPGSGAVTKKVLAIINKQPKQSRWLLEQFDKNPDVFEQLAAMNERDTKFSTLLSSPERADLRKVRDDVVKKFGSLTAFFDWVKKHGAAGYPAVGALQLGSPDEGSQ